MRRGPIPLLMHASIEPIAAILLIGSSWLFGFSDNGTAQIVTIIIGVVMLVSGAMTDWRVSLVRLIPLRTQLMTDLLLGVVLIISPFVFGYSSNGAATRFAIIFGALELLIALSTRWEQPDEFTGTRLRGTGARAAH